MLTLQTMMSQSQKTKRDVNLEQMCTEMIQNDTIKFNLSRKGGTVSDIDKQHHQAKQKVLRVGDFGVGGLPMSDSRQLATRTLQANYDHESGSIIQRGSGPIDTKTNIHY